MSEPSPPIFNDDVRKQLEMFAYASPTSDAQVCGCGREQDRPVESLAALAVLDLAGKDFLSGLVPYGVSDTSYRFYGR